MSEERIRYGKQLCDCTAAKDYEAVKLLLSRSDKLSFINGVSTEVDAFSPPLILASQHGNNELVSLLINNGCDINITTIVRSTHLTVISIFKLIIITLVSPDSATQSRCLGPAECCIFINKQWM
jgi:ankyrin repeat protein